MSQHQPDIVRHRIGDAEREDVVERLRRASDAGRLTLDEFEERVGSAYGARHAGELERLVADLPAPTPPPDPGPSPLERPASPPVRWTVGVLGGSRRHGPWYPAERTSAVAVLGSCRLDVSEALLPPVTEIRALAVFGGVEVVVPAGVHVEVSGFALLGSRDDRVRRSPSPPDDAPRLRVRARAVCGGVTVRTPSRPVP